MDIKYIEEFQDFDLYDKYALDTNALLWMFYPNSIKSNTEANLYSDLITKLIEKDKKVIIFTYNLCEFLYVIEKIECKIYNKNNKTKIKLKEFRRIPELRQKVKEQIDLVYSQIANINQIQIEQSELDLSILSSFMINFSEHYFDFFDFYLQDYCSKNSIPIISDDKDFKEYYDYVLITNNKN